MCRLQKQNLKKKGEKPPPNYKRHKERRYQNTLLN